MNNLSDEAKCRYEVIEKILLKTGGNEIYSFVDLLDALGLRLIVALKDD